MNNKILDYINLIYKVMNDLHCDKDDETQDEMFFEGLLGLDRAMKTYKKGSTKEITYYYVCIRNAITTKFDFNTRIKRDKLNTISLETPIYDNLLIADMLPSDYNLEQEIIRNEQLDTIYKVLSESKNTQFKKYIYLYYGIGAPRMRVQEIAKVYGVSPKNVCQSIRQGIGRLRKKVKKEYYARKSKKDDF